MCRFRIAASFGLLIVLLGQPAWTQDADTENKIQPPKDREQQQQFLFERLKKKMTDSRLVGSFTVLGQENQKLRAEEYHILSVEKMDKGDYWKFTARIKYGDHDLTVPMPIEIKWAGSTPVITVDKLTIPGLGTFDARVILRQNKYAGTWAHDDVGGHLFGRIEKLEDDKKEPSANEKSDSEKNAASPDDSPPGKKDDPSRGGS